MDLKYLSSLALVWTGSLLPCQRQEALYALVIGSTQGQLMVIDPQTGGIKSAVGIPPPSWQGPGAWAPTGLAHGGSNRLLSFEQGTWNRPTYLMSLHPASASPSIVGPTMDWVFGMSFDVDPTTAMVYVVLQQFGPTGLENFLYKVDPMSGAPTLITQIPFSSTGLLGIDPQGTAYVCNFGNQVSVLDLTTGSAFVLGNISGLPNGTFIDIAFDSNGRMFAQYTHNSIGEVYEIDLSSLSATLLVSLPNFGHFGIAFAPFCESVSYCTAKANSLGCLPVMSTNGQPSLSAASGFTISAMNVRNNRLGFLFFGTSGRTAVPFQGGTLCVAPPLTRTPAVGSGGSAAPVQDCSGVWTMDFNTYTAAYYPFTRTPLPPTLSLGTVVNCQWWGRDSSTQAGLSEGVEFTICQ